MKELVLEKFYKVLKIRPDVFIAGFQKCGTTSLYDMLCDTPYFKAGKEKENNKLSNRIYKHGSYLKDFPYKSIRRLGVKTFCGSHQLSFVPIGLARLKKHFPDCKVIFIMRNPVDRAISRYLHNQRKVNANIDKPFGLTFEEICEIEINAIHSHFKEVKNYNGEKLYEISSQFSPYGSPVIRGLYLPFIKRFVEAGIDCYFLSLEELTETPQQQLETLFEFLEIPFDSNGIIKFPNSNKASNSRNEKICSSSYLERLKGFYEKPNQMLFSYIKKDFNW